MKTILIASLLLTHTLSVIAQSPERARQQNRAVVDAFFQKLEAIDINGFIELWAEDGEQIMPFAPAGFPRELKGRKAIYNQYKGMPDNFSSMKFLKLTVRETTDPEVFVAEYDGRIDVKLTGKPYNNTYVGIFTVKGGKIARFVEYFNPIILQEAFGSQLQQNFNVSK